MDDRNHNFSEMSSRAMNQLLRLCHLQKYPKGATVIWAGDLPEALIIVVEGTLSVSCQSESGQELLLGYIGHGDFLNEGAIFRPGEASEILVKTRTPCELARISQETLYRALDSELREYAIEILLVLANRMSTYLLETRRKASLLAFLNLQGRIKSVLLEHCHPSRAGYPAEAQLVKISRTELSKVVGCARESVGRVLKVLEEEGVVRLRKRSILVTDPRALAEATPVRYRSGAGATDGQDTEVWRSLEHGVGFR